jgi:hypothetical protein
LEAKVPSLAPWWKEAWRRPARREVLHSQKPDGLFDVVVEAIVAGRGIRGLPVIGLAEPHLTERGGNGAVAVVHGRHAVAADHGLWA